jgi:hypothetical protein
MLLWKVRYNVRDEEGRVIDHDQVALVLASKMEIAVEEAIGKIAVDGYIELVSTTLDTTTVFIVTGR